MYTGLTTPFADIVAMSLTEALAIVMQVTMAIIFLKEVCVCKYDLTAIFIILFGSGCIVMTTNLSKVRIRMKDIR